MMVYIVRVHEKAPNQGFVDSLELDAPTGPAAMSLASKHFMMLLKDRPGKWPVEAIDGKGDVTSGLYTITHRINLKC